MDGTLARMLKSGVDVKAYLEAERKRGYTHDFSDFMNQMIKEHRLNRKTLALRAGMSQDYRRLSRRSRLDPILLQVSWKSN